VGRRTDAFVGGRGSGRVNGVERPNQEAFYMDAGVPEYWIVDGEARTITVVHPEEMDRVVTDTLEWSPATAGTNDPLRLDAAGLFRGAFR
jgi:hypothetical protein